MQHKIYAFPVISQSSTNAPFSEWKDLDNISNKIVTNRTAVKTANNTFCLDDDKYASCYIGGKGSTKNTPPIISLSRNPNNVCNVIPKGSKVYKLYIYVNFHCTGMNGKLPKVKINKLNVNLGNGEHYEFSDNVFKDYAYFKEVPGKNTDNNIYFIHDFTKKNSIKKVNLNSPTFGLDIGFSKNESVNSGTLYIDYISYRIDYIPPATGNITSGKDKNVENEEKNKTHNSNTNNAPNVHDTEELANITRMVSNGEMHTSFPTLENPKTIYSTEQFDYNVYYSSNSGLSNYTEDNQEVIQINIPDGLELYHAETTGSYDYGKNLWYPPPVFNQTSTLTLTFKAKYIGLFKLSATLEGVRTTLPYYVFVNPHYGTNGVEVNTTEVHLGDRDANCVISIHGDSNGTLEHQWEFNSSDTVFPYDSGKVYVSKDSTNVETVYQTTEGNTKRFTVRVIDITKDYNAIIVTAYNPRTNVQINHDSIYSVDSGKYYNYDIDVKPAIPNVVRGVGQHFKIKKPNWNESYVIYPDGESHKSISVIPMCGEKFRINPPNISFVFEKPFGYLGCIKTQRAHVPPKHNFSNPLISNGYKNRRNYGKKGLITESTTLNITLPKKDWVTIDGLCAMDKPIPIDLIPNWWEGDPLNHRGWAILSDVKNVQKINDMVYNGDLTVTYLNHDIKTKFNVTRQERVCHRVIDYIITTTLDNTESLLKYMRIVNPVIGESGNYGFGEVSSKNSDSPRYENHLLTDRGESIAIRSIHPVGNNANIRFDWINTLVKHTNYDLKDWKMFVRLRNKSDLKTEFEYMYYDFVHMYDNEEIVNKCNVMVKYMDNNIERVRNYANVYLNWNNLKSTDITEKIDTKLIVNDTTITKMGDKFTALLTDIDGNPLINKKVTIQLSDETRTKPYVVTTDSTGLAQLIIRLSEQKNYTAQVYFEGDDTYKAVNATVSLIVKYDGAVTTYISANDQTITHMGDFIKPVLKTSSGTPLSGVSLNFKAVPVSKGKTIMVNRTTDINGMAKASFWGAGGTYNLTISYIGSDTYAPASVTIKLYVKLPLDYNVNNVVFIDTSKTQTLFKDKGSELGIYLYNHDNKPLSGRVIHFTLYNDKDGLNKDYTCTTLGTGYAKVPICLNDGIYHAYIHYDGKLTGTPLEMPSSNEVEFTVKGNTKNNTRLIGENLTISNSDDVDYSVTLFDTERNKPVPHKKIRMMFRYANNLDGGKVGYDLETDENGIASKKIELDNGQYRIDSVFPVPIKIFESGNREVLFNPNGSPTTDGEDMGYDSSTLTTYLNVNRPQGGNKKTATKITTPIDGLIIDTADYELTVTLTSDPDGNNSPLAGQEVAIKMNSTLGGTPHSKTYIKTTDDKGQASVKVNLTNNDSSNPKYSYSVSYGGNNLFNPTSTEEHTFTVNIPASGGVPSPSVPVSKLSKNDCTITSKAYDWYIVLTDNLGNPMTGESVSLDMIRLSDNVSKTYWVTTDNQGQAHETIRLNNGNYKVVANYAGKGEIKGSGSISNFTVNVPKTKTELLCDTTKSIVYKQGGVNFKLWDMDNNVSIKYTDITIYGRYKDPNRQGVEKYVMRTAQDGSVYLAVNHPAGEYIFTAEYGGDDTYQECTGQTDLTVEKVN